MLHRLGAESFRPPFRPIVARFGCLLAFLPLTACGQPPETLPLRLHDALVRGDDAAVLALIDRNNRPLVQAMLQVPADARGQRFFRALGQGAQAPQVVKVDAGEVGLTLSVRAPGDPTRTREWALVREDGDWRLDFSATAARRSWDTP